MIVARLRLVTSPGSPPLFAGPIIAREVLTTPRPLRFFLMRAAYAGMLFILMWTAWQSLIGWQDVRDVGIMSRFGKVLYQIFAFVELTLMLFFAPIAAATAVAHEKDRRTFLLLLMTDLRDVEIVLGKLAASLLLVATMLATSAPIFFISLLIGGISAIQMGEVLSVTASAGLVGGSLGLLVALWRDRTFQSLALTVMVVVLTMAGVEVIGSLLPNARILGIPLPVALNPYRTMTSILEPVSETAVRPGPAFVIVAILGAVLLNLISVSRLRVWNPGRNEPREQREGQSTAEGIETIVELGELPVQPVLASAVAASDASGTLLDNVAAKGAASQPQEDGATTGLHVPRRSHRRVTRAPGVYRKPWNNPILWRELMTRAYGAKPLIIKFAYGLIFFLLVAFFYANPNLESDPWRSAKVLIPLGILSLILINAQGVTSLTSERDSGALDLLLVTELSPKEFIYGKLYGVLYNTKEMVLGPILLTIWFAFSGVITTEVAIYILIDFLLLCHFSGMLGLHAAITYTNSRAAVANSLGTIFFLMVGILVCAFLIILSDREFGRQLLSFMIFIGAGSVALFASLGSRNPSQAIALVALLTPFWSFYCIISLLNGDVMASFLFSVGIYGFALLAMLVPAVSDFDIALGRTNAIQG